MGSTLVSPRQRQTAESAPDPRIWHMMSCPGEPDNVPHHEEVPGEPKVLDDDEFMLQP